MINNFFYLLFFLAIKNNSFSQSNSELKLHYAMLPVTVKNTNYQLAHDIFSTSYQGVCYQTPLSSHFGGQVILKNEDFTTCYYLMIAEKVNLQMDSKGCIKGYTAMDNAKNSSKLYYIEINLFNDVKNTMLYDWKITELQLKTGQMIPEKTIIIYANPENIILKNFSTTTKKVYPYMEKNQVTTLILPTIEFRGKYDHIMRVNNNAAMENSFGQNIIKQIHL